MLDKICVFDSEKYGSVWLHAPYNADPHKLLEMYIEWYHSDFSKFEEHTDERTCEDFKFSFYECPLDFYDDYIKKYKVHSRLYL